MSSKLSRMEEPHCSYCLNEYYILDDTGKAECRKCRVIVSLSQWERICHNSNVEAEYEVTLIQLEPNSEKAYPFRFDKPEHSSISQIRSMNDGYRIDYQVKSI